MSGRLEGKAAVITGAASGIGWASTVRFAHEGGHVLAADILDDKGAELERLFPGRVRYRRTDVTQEAEIAAALDACRATFGRLDCLFNNAGVGGVTGPLETLDFEAYDRTMAVLLKAVFAGFKHAVPLLRAQGGGVILSTASIAGLQPGYGPHVYSAAKAAVIQLTRTAARDLGMHNIRVNAICPGIIATPIFGVTLGKTRPHAEKLVPLLQSYFEKLQPIPRAGQPDDVAALAAFLASDDASFISGQAIVVDGALTVGEQFGKDFEALNKMLESMTR